MTDSTTTPSRTAPRHFGEPALEYRAALDGAALFERAERTQLVMRGRDPLKMLQGLLTNDLAGAPEGRGVYAALLTPKGRMIADVRAFRTADGAVLLDLDAAALDDALAHFRKYVPPLFAKPETPDPPLRVLAVHGPAAADVVRRATGVALDPAAPELSFLEPDDADGVALVARSDDAGVPGLDLFVEVGAADRVAEALVEAGARRAGRGAFEALRIEAGRPRWGAELDAERIPLEAGLLERAISTGKGCYTGQEVIIRILHRGHVNWTLRGLLLGEAPAPAAGAELTRPGEEKTVARVTSACASPRLDQTVALGYVRREVEPGTRLALKEGGAEAVVVELPFGLAGGAADADTPTEAETAR